MHEIMQDNAREAKYAKNHFQQNRYSVFESHVMRKETLSTKIFRAHMATVRGVGYSVMDCHSKGRFSRPSLVLIFCQRIILKSL